MSVVSSCRSASVAGSLESSESCFSQQTQTLGHRDFVPGRRETTGQGKAKGRVGPTRPRAQVKTAGGPSTHMDTITPKVRASSETQAGTSQSPNPASAEAPSRTRLELWPVCQMRLLVKPRIHWVQVRACPAEPHSGGRGAGPWLATCLLGWGGQEPRSGAAVAPQNGSWGLSLTEEGAGNKPGAQVGSAPEGLRQGQDQSRVQRRQRT